MVVVWRCGRAEWRRQRGWLVPAGPRRTWAARRRRARRRRGRGPAVASIAAPTKRRTTANPDQNTHSIHICLIAGSPPNEYRSMMDRLMETRLILTVVDEIYGDA